jgi:serine phosphatase RsbU (regulator of sigma subunit)
MEGLPRNLAERLENLIFSERSVAYLEIDADFVLVGAGGHLGNYGLAEVRTGEPVIEQAFFLEGLLPIVEDPYFVPSVELASGRSADLHFHLDRETTWLLLLDVTTERDASRRVQQKAYDMTLLQEREALLNQRLEAANAALLVTQRQLEAARDAVQAELRRKQVELGEARTLQLALAPPAFRGTVGGWPVAIDVVLEPAKEVGGDLVDYFSIGDDLLVLLLGDVSGKGAAAALMMARTHALFRGMAGLPDAPQLFRSPEKVLHQVNTILARGNAHCMFVTFLIAVFDGATNLVSYVRAGHLPPLLRRASGAVDELDALGGPPLGLLEDAIYTSANVRLQSGDQLLIITDGITEAMNPAEQFFGDDRVAEVVAFGDGGDATLLQNLITHVRMFEAGAQPFDDKAGLLMRLENG